MKKQISRILIAFILGYCLDAAASEPVTIVVDKPASARVQFGVEKLAETLNKMDVKTTLLKDSRIPSQRPLIVVGNIKTSRMIQKLIRSKVITLEKNPLGKEGFTLKRGEQDIIVVAGADDSGTLYGCLELADRIRKFQKIPDNLNVTDAPVFHLRGPCIGMQKTYILPGWGTYNYPYTPELFPFFYDKQQWLEFLDLLVENRMNTLYLWNGHPFSSLVKVKDYPEAIDVSEDVFRRNQEIFQFLTTEADKRGIWVIQMFYNIHFSKSLAQKFGVETHHPKPTELNCDYTRKSIAEFVKSYPNVGLLVCLGEALSGEQNKKYWLTEVIIPGVQDGMKALRLKQEPPIIIREHTMGTSAREIIGAGLKKYKNLYTMMKYNGEALTTCQPRGPWAEIHRELSSITSQHVSNIHILANLEPFRYGATRFIQKCVQAARDIHHANGIHLYPLAYWDWPISPDTTEIKQCERDWIWFAAWARYAWNPDRDVEEENAYWTTRLAELYGSKEAAAYILEAYNQAGLCAPKILRRFGITNGNRQTMSLGMTLEQLVRPNRYRLWPRLVDSDGPPGERLEEYVEKDWKGQPHTGETPVMVIEDILKHADAAVDAINQAQGQVQKNQEEFERLKNDVLCIRAMSKCYAAKASAALHILRYQYNYDVAELEKALPLLQESLQAYRELTELTKDHYRYANSLQTSVRKIPFNGADGKYKHWTECLPVYEQEFDKFKSRLEELKKSQSTATTSEQEISIQPLTPAPFQLLSGDMEVYEVKKGAKVFKDCDYAITELAPELNGLKGIRFSHNTAQKEGVQIELEVGRPVKALLGYFQTRSPLWLQPPDLETKAGADDRGEYEPVIRNALAISGLPGVNVYVLTLSAGKHKLDFGRGSYIFLGVINASTTLTKRDAQINIDNLEYRLDWLFE